MHLSYFYFKSCLILLMLRGTQIYNSNSYGFKKASCFNKYAGNDYPVKFVKLKLQYDKLLMNNIVK